MIHERATTPVLRVVPTDGSPSGWFAGAGDNRDHAIGSWCPDESGYLSTACGRPSAQAGRTVNRPCPACQQAEARTRSARSSESGVTYLRLWRRP
jgi:hypothetical protein